MAKIEAEKELALKELELKAQTHAQASIRATVYPPLRNRDAKSPKLPAFIDEKDGYRKRFREVKPETEETPD